MYGLIEYIYVSETNAYPFHFSVFGKTMENTREYRKIDLCSTKEKAEALAKHPSFRAQHHFHDNLISVERYETAVTLNKPIYTGAAVLELSKLLMLDFHYDFIKQQYPGNKSTLAFTDTDSLLYAIETDNVYADMRQHHEHFDLSNYPDDHQIFANDHPEVVKWLKKKNKKVVGKMKDEAGGDPILEFVGLRAKAYAYLQESYDKDLNAFTVTDNKKLKGIKKSTVKKKIHFDHYKKCLFSGIDHFASMVTFQSKLHQLTTVEQVKKALCRYDDKRFIHHDGITTTAHGHTDNIFQFMEY